MRCATSARRFQRSPSACRCNGMRELPCAALPASGDLPPPQISAQASRGPVTTAACEFFGMARSRQISEDNGWYRSRTGARHDPARSMAVVATNSPISDRFAHPYQDGAVPHLRHGVRAAARRPARCALLGHGRAISLCAPAAGTEAGPTTSLSAARTTRAAQADDADAAV